MDNGWIYLKKDVNTDGTARGYKFGLTNSNKRRSREYRTENSSIIHLEDYETNEMECAEAELEWKAEAGGMLLYPNSTEWIKPECFDEFMILWNTVKETYHIDAPPLVPVEVVEEFSDVYEPDTYPVASFIGNVLYYTAIAGGLILLYYAIQYFMAIIVLFIGAVFFWCIITDAGKPRRRRRRAW